MPLRLWQYIGSIWNECVKQNKRKKGKLPLVIPLIFFNGRKPYNGARDIRELIDAPKDLIEYFLLKPFHLIDVHDIKDEDLKKQYESNLMTFVMKNIFAKEVMHNIQDLVQLILFQVKAKMLGDDYLTTVLKYYVDNAETAYPTQFREVIENELVDSKGGEIMATLASYLTQQGRQEGRQEGEASLLINMLKIKFKNLSDLYVEKINRADVNTLNQWGINLMNAQSLDEVFG